MIANILEKCRGIVEVSVLNDIPSPNSTFGPYKLLHEMGRGRQCVVYAAQLNNTQKLVAIKLFQRQHVDEAFITGLARELKALRALQHRHIVKIQSVIIGSKYVGCVMPLARNADVFQYLSKHGVPPLELGLRWLRQTRDVLAYMHARSYAHRDIKPENLLLDENLDIVLTDFEFCSYFGRQGFAATHQARGTPPYCAPECILNSGPYDLCKADVWAAGGTFYAVFTAMLPFQAWEFPHSTAQDIANLYAHIARTPLIFYPDAVPTIIQSLLRRMLTVNPDNRITSADLVSEKLHDEKYGTINSLSVPEDRASIVQVCASPSYS